MRCVERGVVAVGVVAQSVRGVARPAQDGLVLVDEKQKRARVHDGWPCALFCSSRFDVVQPVRIALAAQLAVMLGSRRGLSGFCRGIHG